MGSKPLQAFVELKEISKTSGLSKETVQKVLKKQLSSIELCYQKALEKNPNIQGGMILQLAIDSKGRVKKVSLVLIKLNDKNLEQCIIQKVKGLNFPPLEGTEKVTATISLNFKTS